MRSSLQPPTSPELAVALLTGGGDRPYVYGLGTALLGKVATLDIIGSDELDCPEFHGHAGVRFRNLRGDQRPDAAFAAKLLRVGRYYVRLVGYAATAQPKIFHILWNNRFELLDRTLLMLYYRLLGKKTVLTVHNVNSARRDSRDTRGNRLTLGLQYRLAGHIFVHTEKMKQELVQEFGLQGERITVIPFGINNAVPHTRLTPRQARERLGLGSEDKTLLFFGNIAPYKGLEYLVAAFHTLPADAGYRLVIAGRPTRCETYWGELRRALAGDVQSGRVLLRDEFIPDEETEIYFKAADALVLPYRRIYQSGVLFLGHSFGVPVLATDVGSLKDDIIEGQTGFSFRPEDATDLACTIERYFASELYSNLNARRTQIRDYALKHHSWEAVAQTTLAVYASLLPSALRTETSELSLG